MGDECLGLAHAENSVADCATISLGATAGRVYEHSIGREFIKKANEALYLSKRNGRDQYTYIWSAGIEGIGGALRKCLEFDDPPLMKAGNANAESRGAGLGLIEIARRASSKIEYSFTPLEDGLAFFSMFVTIS